MVDLTGKFITTMTNEESERLLRMASARGYRTDIGLKALVNKRLFHFSEFPKWISTPALFKAPNNLYTYQELFGEEDEEMNRILSDSLRFCRAHGYSLFRIYVDEETMAYKGKAIAKGDSGDRKEIGLSIGKPIKLSKADIELLVGCPVEIVS